VHVLTKDVIDVVEDHFVIKHEVRRKLLAGQKRRSYLKSRAAPGAYEGMVKGPGPSPHPEKIRTRRSV
uniref:hypothetical protein n=1 Tax=Aeromonas caviae TaxID=648 RepID=UPI0023784C56